jgi:uncharacterized protein YjbI with pentapeptide repeats
MRGRETPTLLGPLERANLKHCSFLERANLKHCSFLGTKLENTTFRKMDLLTSSGEGKGDTYSAGSLRKS